MSEPKSKSLREIADELARDTPASQQRAAQKQKDPAAMLGIPAKQAQAAGEPARAAMTALLYARHAGGGAVRQKHLAEAQTQITHIDPRKHADLLRHLQAHIVAMSGRGGDTEIAHLTPGEIVIPKRLQTPEFVKALYVAAHAFGIDLARLVVGSGKNVINPRTGQPEFDDEGNDGGNNDGNIEEITVTAPRLPWSSDDYYYGERLPFTEDDQADNPDLARAIISTAINRVGLPGYGKHNDTLAGTITEPGQLQDINDNADQPWRLSQDPSQMDANQKRIFNSYADVVRRRMSGELPDNSGGATFLHHGEPTADDLARMSSGPLVQTNKIGDWWFYKPTPRMKP